MSGWPINPDGSVTSASQIDPDEFDPHVGGMPVVGIVVSVQPSDDKGNLAASVEDDQRGYRHEATVVVTNSGGEDNWILSNVVIPGRNRSNYDDYDEDLPVGVSKLLNGKPLTENWKTVDPALLDGDYCVVNFIGGDVDMPFIQNWWPHPKNKIDPATSGAACLTQFDPTKTRSRTFRRINGVKQVINKGGDVYFSTSEAGSRIDLSGKKPVRRDVTKGGSVQVNVKSSQQLEFNWNAEVEGLQAGSNSKTQTRDPDLPHLDHTKATKAPPARSTDATILRFKQQEATISTGKAVIRCHEDGGGDGFFMATGDSGVVIGQGASGEVLASLSISEGELLLSTPDGDNIALSSDQIAISASGGSSVVLQGTSIAINAAGGVTIGTATGAQPVINGTVYNTAETALLALLTAVVVALTAIQGEWETAANKPDKWQPLAVTQTALKTALTGLASGIVTNRLAQPTWLTKLISGL